MRAPVLKIRKKVLDVQGQMLPCVQVQAIVDDQVRAILEESFSSVILFKRTMFAAGIPAGMTLPDPALAPLLLSFLKKDNCPELSVKSILSGQLYQAKDPWEVLCFEWIGKRSFDALVLMILCATELGTETEYAPVGRGSLVDDIAVDEPPAAADPGADVANLTEAA